MTEAPQAAPGPEGPAKVDYVLPDVGEGLQEAEIVAWRVGPGDRIAEDEILVEVQTDKSVVEIPSPHTGVVARLGADVGDVVPVGAVLAVIDVDPDSDAGGRHGVSGRDDAGERHEAGGRDDAAHGGQPQSAADAADEVRTAGATSADGDGRRRGRVLASPATRRLAIEQGVDLAGLEGTGPAGRVTREDVERASRASQPAGQRVETEAALQTAPQPVGDDGDQVEPLRGVRRRIAETMTAAAAIPAIAEWRQVEATALLAVHGRLRAHLEPDGVRLTLLPLIVKAILAALRRHPRFNARIDVERDEIVYRRRYHLGVATATPDGLIVPVVRDADRRSLTDLAREIERLALAARNRSIAREDTTDGTFTVSNYGSFGTRVGVPLLRPPEVAIAGVGRVHDAVLAIDGQPAVRPVLPVTVATDHRLNDGDHLAAFAADVEAYLADPALLLAESP